MEIALTELEKGPQQKMTCGISLSAVKGMLHSFFFQAKQLQLTVGITSQHKSQCVGEHLEAYHMLEKASVVAAKSSRAFLRELCTLKYTR